ncbi:hypothetical protein AB0M20_26850, partial [Actinoplanes sp. NPDC051633]|uniref:hypothetical protein n=1 Tax=Actinoplanes sp. NPDC051633 TaxID=3155670 RepID=UPI00342895F1
ALYAGLTRLERARPHLRVGEALEGLGGAATPEGVARLTHHFGLSARIGGADRAVRYATMAAEQATAQHAHERAVEFWEQALAATTGPRYPLLIELGRARRLTGDTEGAREILEEAITAATRAGDTPAVIRAATVFGGITVWNWRPCGVVDQAMVDRLSKLLAGETLTDAQRAGLLGTLGLELYYGPRRAEGREYARQAVEMARRIGDTDLLAHGGAGRLDRRLPAADLGAGRGRAGHARHGDDAGADPAVRPPVAGHRHRRLVLRLDPCGGREAGREHRPRRPGRGARSGRDPQLRAGTLDHLGRMYTLTTKQR